MANASSSKFTNIARPYALAAFEFARDNNELPIWKAFLASAATLAENPQADKLINHPEVQPEELYSLFEDVLSSVLDQPKKNLLRLLARNRRLYVLPAVSEIFDNYYAALEKLSDVKVVTAIDLSNEYERKLADALSKRTALSVKLKCEVDPQILGGAIIHIGDRVLDGSVRGKLTRLYQSLAD